MQKRFAQKIEDMRRLIGDNRSASFLLAVSGGMDSMCMADLFLNELGADSFAVAHCNFHLRGAESDGDEALVKAWADSNGVRMHRVDFDTREYASAHGVSIEMAARDLRYGWFARLCDEFGYDVVAVAHNANDNAETLMLNLLRGTGLNGLRGMAEVSIKRKHLLRPLLEFTRKQIEGYVIARRVQYRDDSSNFESEYKRNRIRNEVFPVFEKVNPSFVRTLNREIGYFSEAGEIVEDWCRAQLPDVLTCPDSRTECGLHCHPERSEGSLVINLPALLAKPHWRYLLYYILEPYGFNSQTLESIEDLLASERTVSGKRFESQDWVLRTERQHLLIVPKITGQAGHDGPVIPGRPVIPDLIGDPFIPVRAAGTYHCNGQRFLVEVLSWSEDMPLKQPAGVLIFDAAKLKFPFVCRKWRQGDWLVPLGMKGRKKVSDLFADLKYGSFEKEAALMIVDCVGERAEQQHVAGVLGERIDKDYKVSAETEDIIRITLLNDN